MLFKNFSKNYCKNEKNILLIDNIVSSVILGSFFLVGTLGNLLFVCVHVQKRYKGLNQSSFKPTLNRYKNQINNQAIFSLSLVNLLLSSVFLPYTIVFRVWSLPIGYLSVLVVIEHIKDALLYMNLFIISILSLERYFAVCKPQYYKNLEININKIIWLFYLISILVSTSNYFTNIKFNLSCMDMSQDKIKHNITVELFEGVNLLVSAFLFLTTAIVSSFFYIKITIHQSNNSFWQRHLLELRNLSRMSFRSLHIEEQKKDNREIRFKSRSRTSLKSNSITKIDRIDPICAKGSIRRMNRSSSVRMIAKMSIWVSFIFKLECQVF